ncbi:MAG: hypothetical protein KKE02_12280 [Alphaproteobacteria bacterium]|nr:hypothetical protein [Alphaproteobacteria bacterium]MBU1514052.1 hypothetical protein [Alphaproteobacteria bacterium]MBU2093008.1 hypothetical protein [Alphaproteobacteria bacterium]MBU2151789.1 hypothetical protein [Alphaproteobacteria bacterium]MBU2309391.1 hypothetical protein [Alphaproteobacteria bacterium]
MAGDTREEGGFAGLLRMIFRPSVAKAEVRAEIWRLGERHRGWPLEGALAELKEPGLPMARAILLRACVQQLRAQ